MTKIDRYASYKYKEGKGQMYHKIHILNEE